MDACLQRRRARPTPTVGEHRDQRSEGFGRSVHQVAGRTFTANTMPESALQAFADHGDVGSALPSDDRNAEHELAEFARERIDVHVRPTSFKKKAPNRSSNPGTI